MHSELGALAGLEELIALMTNPSAAGHRPSAHEVVASSIFSTEAAAEMKRIEKLHVSLAVRERQLGEDHVRIVAMRTSLEREQVELANAYDVRSTELESQQIAAEVATFEASKAREEHMEALARTFNYAHRHTACTFTLGKMYPVKRLCHWLSQPHAPTCRWQLQRRVLVD